MRWGDVAHVMVAKGKRHRYYVQPSHGRGWHATEKCEATQLFTATALFHGPTACDDARKWCEARNRSEGAATRGQDHGRG